MATELITPIDPGLLAGLTDVVLPTDVSLSFSRPLAANECTVLMASAYNAENRCNWYLGDLILHAELHHGDDAFQIFADAMPGISESRYKHLKYTAAAFQGDDVRRIHKSWSVYRELAKNFIGPDKKLELLNHAGTNDLSSREVAKLVNDECDRDIRAWDISDVITAIDKAWDTIVARTSAGDVDAMLRKWRTCADEHDTENNDG
jgi:hypothetical protein